MTTETERVEQTIEGVAAGVRAENVDMIMEYISPAFDGGGGDSDTLRNTLPALFGFVKASPGSWSLTEPPVIDMERHTASVKVHGKSYGGKGGLSRLFRDAMKGLRE